MGRPVRERLLYRPTHHLYRLGPLLDNAGLHGACCSRHLHDPLPSQSCLRHHGEAFHGASSKLERDCGRTNNPPGQLSSVCPTRLVRATRADPQLRNRDEVGDPDRSSILDLKRPF